MKLDTWMRNTLGSRSWRRCTPRKGCPPATDPWTRGTSSCLAGLQCRCERERLEFLLISPFSYVRILTGPCTSQIGGPPWSQGWRRWRRKRRWQWRRCRRWWWGRPWRSSWPGCCSCQSWWWSRRRGQRSKRPGRVAQMWAKLYLVCIIMPVSAVNLKIQADKSHETNHRHSHLIGCI